MNLNTVRRLPYLTPQDKYSEWYDRAIKHLVKEYEGIDEYPKYTFKATGTIINGKEFVRAHMAIACRCNANKRFHVYIYRLIEYLKFLKQ